MDDTSAHSEANPCKLLGKFVREPIRDFSITSPHAFKEFYEAKLRLLQFDIQAGLADLESGATVDEETFFKELQQEFG